MSVCQRGARSEDLLQKYLGARCVSVPQQQLDQLAVVLEVVRVLVQPRLMLVDFVLQSISSFLLRCHDDNVSVCVCVCVCLCVQSVVRKAVQRPRIRSINEP